MSRICIILKVYKAGKLGVLYSTPLIQTRKVLITASSTFCNSCSTLKQCHTVTLFFICTNIKSSPCDFPMSHFYVSKDGKLLCCFITSRPQGITMTGWYSVRIYKPVICICILVFIGICQHFCLTLLGQHVLKLQWKL